MRIPKNAKVILLIFLIAFTAIITVNKFVIPNYSTTDSGNSTTLKTTNIIKEKVEEANFTVNCYDGTTAILGSHEFVKYTKNLKKSVMNNLDPTLQLAATSEKYTVFYKDAESKIGYEYYILKDNELTAGSTINPLLGNDYQITIKGLIVDNWWISLLKREQGNIEEYKIMILDVQNPSYYRIINLIRVNMDYQRIILPTSFIYDNKKPVLNYAVWNSTAMTYAIVYTEINLKIFENQDILTIHGGPPQSYIYQDERVHAYNITRNSSVTQDSRAVVYKIEGLNAQIAVLGPIDQQIIDQFTFINNMYTFKLQLARGYKYLQESFFVPLMEPAKIPTTENGPSGNTAGIIINTKSDKPLTYMIISDKTTDIVNNHTFVDAIPEQSGILMIYAAVDRLWNEGIITQNIEVVFVQLRYQVVLTTLNILHDYYYWFIAPDLMLIALISYQAYNKHSYTQQTNEELYPKIK